MHLKLQCDTMLKSCPRDRAVIDHSPVSKQQVRQNGVAASSIASNPAGALPRVLVVDDLVDAAVTLGKLLEILGCEVRTATDGAAALTVAASFQPQIVLLDIGLPRLDGYEVAGRLRAATETKDAHLVALTGFGGDADKARALDSGFDEHMLKPATLEQLQQLLRRASHSPSGSRSALSRPR
jgi:CheY-like chemotaxis protein